MANAAELLQHHVGVGRAQVAIPAGGPSDEGVDVRRNRLDEARGSRDVVVHVLVGDLDRTVAEVRLAAGEELKGQHAQGVDVGPGVGAAVSDELGRQVGDRTHQDPPRCGGAGGGADCASEAEVSHLDLPARVDQHVLRFDVAVDDARLVGRRDRQQDLLHDPQCSGGRQWCLGSEGVTQRAASRDVLHRKKEHTAVLALVVDADDVGVGQSRRGARLADEPLSERLVVRQGLGHHLEGHPAVQAQVGRLVDRRHAAPRDPSTDEVPPVENPPDEAIGSRGRRKGRGEVHLVSLRSRSLPPRQHSPVDRPGRDHSPLRARPGEGTRTVAGWGGDG